ncbi:class I SAM-dependent methyltransferase [Shewanella halifaxensis]|uniref:class I SAM-dependent methyltransferase n=1 Tax=Shewanella halifaxensis TaxID=271098 RepID=UPI000D58D88A|nr:class I SAM-dependent methyltransferase [Shewanella halifaxensis]
MKKKLVLQILAVITLIASIAWVVSDFSYEPVIVALVSASGFLILAWREQQSKHVYELDKAPDFYGKIAKMYDERNTKFLKDSHIITVKHIKEAIVDQKSADILDLGGGTGINVAAHFFNRTNITWHYVDATAEMKVAFEKNVESASFKHVSKLSDLNIYMQSCEQKFDVIVVSFALTSLPYQFDISKAASLLKEKGSLVIADIEPEYNAKYPEYAVEVDNELHALSVTQVNPLDLIESALNENLKVKFCQSIKKNDGVRYAYVIRLGK